MPRTPEQRNKESEMDGGEVSYEHKTNEELAEFVQDTAIKIAGLNPTMNPNHRTLIGILSRRVKMAVEELEWRIANEQDNQNGDE